MIHLDILFSNFCEYLDGKLRWGDKSKIWTEKVFCFFSEFNKAETIPYKESREYLTIDSVWRYDPAKYSTDDIELAVEHENSERNIEVLLDRELRHLIDIKARNKLGIFYINLGDEEGFIHKIKEAIRRSTPYNSERYLIILGYATRKARKPAILFKGFFLDEKGELTDRKQYTVFQRLEELEKPAG